LARVPFSYWLSPRVSTTCGSSLRRSLAVAPMWQAVAVPWPRRKLRLAGSQAMSPAAAITGEGAGRRAAGRTGCPGKDGTALAAHRPDEAHHLDSTSCEL